MVDAKRDTSVFVKPHFLEKRERSRPLSSILRKNSVFGKPWFLNRGILGWPNTSKYLK
jgi:hypothetical protein